MTYLRATKTCLLAKSGILWCIYLSLQTCLKRNKIIPKKSSEILQNLSIARTGYSILPADIFLTKPSIRISPIKMKYIGTDVIGITGKHNLRNIQEQLDCQLSIFFCYSFLTAFLSKC